MNKIKQAKVAKAVEYDRASCPERSGAAADGDPSISLTGQPNDVERAAGKSTTEIVKQFVDSVRAAETADNQRPGLNEMVSYLERHPGEIDYVIVPARSRVFRNYLDAVHVEAKLHQLGVRLISATEETTPEDRFMRALSEALDEKNARSATNSGAIREKLADPNLRGADD